ncbi:MAG: RHS repeat-associated core domain-containing protein [Phycisphaerae bacterium]
MRTGSETMSYSPTLGRFVTRDPTGSVDGLNAYQFGRGNPVAFLDPFGLSATATPTRPPVSPSPVTEGPLWEPQPTKPRPEPSSKPKPRSGRSSGNGRVVPPIINPVLIDYARGTERGIEDAAFRKVLEFKRRGCLTAKEAWDLQQRIERAVVGDMRAIKAKIEAAEKLLRPIEQQCKGQGCYCVCVPCNDKEGITDLGWMESYADCKERCKVDSSPGSTARCVKNPFAPVPRRRPWDQQ